MDDDRKKMAVEDTCEWFVDLRRRVLDPSMEQINSETDLTADYTVVRNGQTPVGLTFTAGPRSSRQSQRGSTFPTLRTWTNTTDG